MRASWSREDNLHLTLKFLGNISAGDIQKLSDSVERTVKIAAPFELTIAGGGAFPPRGRPTVLWLGASDKEASASNLEILHSSIESELAGAGFPREPRPFHPHLTIARLRRPQGARRLAELHQRLGFAPRKFTASEVVVFKSELLKEGSKHTALSRHQLVGREI